MASFFLKDAEDKSTLKKVSFKIDQNREKNQQNQALTHVKQKRNKAILTLDF